MDFGYLREPPAALLPGGRPSQVPVAARGYQGKYMNFNELMD